MGWLNTNLITSVECVHLQSGHWEKQNYCWCSKYSFFLKQVTLGLTQAWTLHHLKGPLIIAIHVLRDFDLIFVAVVLWCTVQIIFKKLLGYWFLTFFFFYIIIVSFLALPSKLRNAVTPPCRHWCMYIFRHLFPFPDACVVWSCSSVRARCSTINSFTGKTLRVRADLLRSGFSGVTWICGARNLLLSLCITDFLCTRRHRLAVLLCILL